MNMGGKVNSRQAVPGIRLMRSAQPHPLDGAEIQHRQVDLFLTTRGMDMVRQMFGGDPRLHRPERVNQKIDDFNATLKEIRANKDALDHLWPGQREHFEKRIKMLFDQFDSCADQAVTGYGGIPSINKGDSRKRGEALIDLLNQEIRKISDDLLKGKNVWNIINQSVDEINRSGQLSLSERQAIDRQVLRTRIAYNAALTYSGKRPIQGQLSTEMQMFEQSTYLLKRMLDRLQEEVKKDLLEMVKEVQKGIDDLARITKALDNIRSCRNHLSEFESQRLNQLLRKQADTAEKAYNEVLASSQKRQSRGQLKSGTRQLKDISDSLKQTLVRLEKGWIDSISRRVEVSSNWFNANASIPGHADEQALAAIREKYKVISASVENAEAIITAHKDDLRIQKIQEYHTSATALEDLEIALAKLAFPIKFQEISGIIEQMASLNSISSLEIPVKKGIGPSNQITEVLREAYARLYDTARTSVLEALRADSSYADLTRTQHFVNKVEAAQKGLKEITQIAERMQELLDTISHLETQTRTIGLNNQIAERLRETYSTLYGDARASIVKAVQAGVSKEALSEAQAAIIRLQSQVRLLDVAGKDLRRVRKSTKKR